MAKIGMAKVLRHVFFSNDSKRVLYLAINIKISYQNFHVRMPSHKYFSHDSDHVVHPGFLASMHKYKDHFKTLHAYYEKQRTDL